MILLENFLTCGLRWFTRIDMLLFIGLFLGTLLLWTQWWRGGRKMISYFMLALILIAIFPFGYWGVGALENRFSQPVQVPQNITGFILLGGNFNLRVTKERGVASYNERAGRLIGFLELAAAHPDKKIVFTGGGKGMDDLDNEASLTAEVMRKLNFNTSHVIFEDKSQDTYENATFSYKKANPKPGETWVLVTSAFHMPRAVGLFRKAGWTILPYPVDYHTTGHRKWCLNMGLLEGLRAWRTLAHEWGGMFVNYMKGRSEALYPHP